MKNMSLGNIAEACGGTYTGDEAKRGIEVTSITTDSRNAEEGCLFVAVKGERVDGHDFIPDMYEKGVLGVLVERAPENASVPYILVASTLLAIKKIAEYYRQQLDVKVIGITGSVGKTSTKEMIASVLSKKYQVLKTLGNFNNELGLPLTVFRLREEHEIAVLEMGISDFGEMHRLSKIAKPDISVITNIGQCHLEFLVDRDGVLRAKSEIFDYLSQEGTIILNGDDDKLASIEEVKGIKPIFFGIDSSRTIYADQIMPMGLKGIQCRIHVGADSFTVKIPIPGYHMVLNALAGTAVGISLGLTLDEIKAGIEKLESVGGRFHIIENHTLTIIDDCYNANPVSMKASLDVLKDAKNRKVAILGDMFELGENADKLHAQVGVHASEQGIDLLICVGAMSTHMADAAKSGRGCKQVIYFKSLEELMSGTANLIREEDTVLVKASHGMHFEKVVELLKGL